VTTSGVAWKMAVAVVSGVSVSRVKQVARQQRHALPHDQRREDGRPEHAQHHQDLARGHVRGGPLDEHVFEGEAQHRSHHQEDAAQVVHVRVAHGLVAARAAQLSCASAASTTASAVMPNFS
jgi:hypothetical protein